MAITIRRSKQITVTEPVGKELAVAPRGLRKQADVVSKQASLLSAQAAVLRDRAAPVGAWAGPRIADVRTRGRAGLDTAYERGVGAAAPRVEQAASALTPKVGATRDKIVDDLLPRLVTVVTAATTAAAAKAATATEVVADRSTTSLKVAHSASLRAQGKPEPKAARGVGRILVLVGAIGAAGATGYTVWKSQRPANDPWVPATATRTTAGPDRLSSPGQGDSVGSGGVASQSTDVDPPAPDGVNATPDLTGDTTPSGPATTMTGGTSTAATGSPASSPASSTDALSTGTGTTSSAGPAAGATSTTTTPIATTATGTAAAAPPVVDSTTTAPDATQGTAKPRKPTTGGTTPGS